MAATLSSLESMLRRHPFVRDLTNEHVTALASCATEMCFQKGDYLWRQGEPAEMFFLILQGEVSLGIAVPGEGLLPVESATQGEVLGWSWMLPPYRWHFDAQAVKPVQAFALNAICLRRHCELDTQLHYELLERLMPVITRRLDATRRKLLDRYLT